MRKLTIASIVIGAILVGGTLSVNKAFAPAPPDPFEEILDKLDQIIATVGGTDTEVSNIEAKLDDGTTGLAAIKSEVDAIEAKLDDGTTGLAAIKAEVDAIEVKLDQLVASQEQVVITDVTVNPPDESSAFVNILLPSEGKVYNLHISLDFAGAHSSNNIHLECELDGGDIEVGIGFGRVNEHFSCDSLFIEVEDPEDNVDQGAVIINGITVYTEVEVDS